MTHQYRILEDVALADTAFEASGDSPSELFLATGQALLDTLADPTTVRPVRTIAVERRDPDLGALLFAWLSHIVYLKDAEALLFREALATVTQERGGWLLRGTLAGEPIDPARHALRADVKAVTKHLYAAGAEGDRWVARVVLDI